MIIRLFNCSKTCVVEMVTQLAQLCPTFFPKYKIVIRENTEVDKRISKKINFMIILNKNSEQIKSNAQPLISNFRYLTIYYYQYLMHMLICCMPKFINTFNALLFCTLRELAVK